MTPGLPDFLQDRLDEDEAAAKALLSEDWGDRPWAVTECSNDEAGNCPCIVYQGEYKPFDVSQVPAIRYVADAETPELATWIARHDPARVLREVKAGRAILRAEMDRALGGVLGYSSVLLDLAAVYSDHPDYRQEWKP